MTTLYGDLSEAQIRTVYRWLERGQAASVAAAAARAELAVVEAIAKAAGHPKPDAVVRHRIDWQRDVEQASRRTRDESAAAPEPEPEPEPEPAPVVELVPAPRENPAPDTPPRLLADPMDQLSRGWRRLLLAHAHETTLAQLRAGRLPAQRVGEAVLQALGGEHSASACPDCTSIEKGTT